MMVGIATWSGPYVTRMMWVSTVQYAGNHVPENIGKGEELAYAHENLTVSYRS